MDMGARHGASADVAVAGGPHKLTGVQDQIRPSPCLTPKLSKASPGCSDLEVLGVYQLLLHDARSIHRRGTRVQIPRHCRDSTVALQLS